MATYGHTFTSGDTVTPTKLNSARTVSDIVNADIKSDAAIAGTKIAPAFGGQDITVSTANRSITNTGNFALSFGTNNTERVRISNDGRVGIGTNSPAAALAVSTGDSRKQFTVDTSADPVVKIGLPDWYSVGALAFVNGSGGERMRIDASGNVGIGTTTPSTWGSNFVVQKNKAAIVADVNNAVQFELFNNSNTTNQISFGQGFANGTDNIGFIYNRANAAFVFGTNNTERMRVKATGQVRFVPLASDPAGAEVGDVYYDLGNNRLRVYTDTGWVNLH